MLFLLQCMSPVLAVRPEGAKIIPPGSLHFTRSPCEIADEQGTFKTQEYPLSPLGTNVPP
jgi:hypothetical protein